MLVPYRDSKGVAEPQRLLHIADAEKHSRFEIKKASMPMGIDTRKNVDNAIFYGVMACAAIYTSWVFASPLREFMFVIGYKYYYAIAISSGLFGVGFGLFCLYHIVKLVEASLVNRADTSGMFTCWSYYQPLAGLIKELGNNWHVAAALMSHKSDLCGALSHILTCYINDVRDAGNNGDEASIEFLTRQAAQHIRQLLNGEIRRQQVTPACHPAT